MNHRNAYFPSIALILLSSAVILLSGCNLRPRQDPSRFFILSPVVEPPAAVDLDGPAIGIGRIDMPSYTDRPQIATREGSNELIFSEFNRWAEPLPMSFGRVVGQNLGGLLNTDRVITYPWSRAFHRDYEVYITVQTFDAFPEQGVVVLSARWSVAAKPDSGFVAEGVINTREPMEARGYPGMVSAWSRAIGVLCRDIAAGIEANMEVPGQAPAASAVGE